jgi:NADPH:quinone reductase-like Zn-dependent oxidoreductase
MTFNDLMLRQGVIDNTPKPPIIMGLECSGVIEALGENTTGFNVGHFDTYLVLQITFFR